MLIVGQRVRVNDKANGNAAAYIGDIGYVTRVSERHIKESNEPRFLCAVAFSGFEPTFAFFAEELDPLQDIHLILTEEERQFLLAELRFPGPRGFEKRYTNEEWDMRKSLYERIEKGGD